MTEELIFYGDDVKIGRFSEETRFIYSNPPIPPAAPAIAMIALALDHPFALSRLSPG